MKKTVLKDFFKYVSLSVVGMIGLSLYILVDTFFISHRLGANGIAALNFSIPVFSLMSGFGLMIGIGGASRYSILKGQNETKKGSRIFSHAICFGLTLGGILLLIGLFFSKPLANLLGADEVTLHMTNVYLKTILCFAPFFIFNNILLGFVRNDNNPNLAVNYPPLKCITF